MDLHTILAEGVNHGASDIHLKHGMPPILNLPPIVERIAQERRGLVLVTGTIARGYSTYGMQTFDQSLMQLWREGFITFDEALAQSTNPDDFALKARGINSSSDSRWDEFDKDEEPEADEGIKVDRF